MKDRKLFYIVIITVCVTAILGISYAWFSTIIEGNENANKHIVTTGDLRLTYTDSDTVTLENAFPGTSSEKTFTIKNSGTVSTAYNLFWQELINSISRDELVIEVTCKRFNSSGTEEGTCGGVSERAVNSILNIKSNIQIEAGITHEYTMKVTFIDTGLEQNYNKNKTFNGKIGIEEYDSLASTKFGSDSWTEIIANVKAGTTDEYNVGDRRTIDLGNKYGSYVVRLANKSTPSECFTEGFSQTACGFVIEFENIIERKQVNSIKTSSGGWPASELRTYINTTLYNEFPTDLKSAVIDTTVVSGYEHGKSANYTSTDKVYLLVFKEIYSDVYDTVKDSTRQLDYYNSIDVSGGNCSGAIKKYGATASAWRLRSANLYSDFDFNVINSDCSCRYDYANYSYGISPAFRIG